ncbi:MAG: sodium/solute symporter, partial [Sulfurimonadaceae bacterium]|nr:sodium/solute symporter [Sulfurimonadaceae bacterium]
MELPTLFSFLTYMIGMVAIGLYFYFKTDNLNDYILGGRGLGPGVTALSAGASDMSGWLLLGLPGMLYDEGLVGVWIAVGLLIGAYANWHLIAKPLRVYTHHLHDALTIPDYLSNRFRDNSNALRITTAVVILLFYTLYTSSGLVGGAKLFEATFGLDYATALIIGSLIIVSYTFLGGYNAVSWTDFVQGILMLLALVITPAVVIYEIGGMSKTLETIIMFNPEHLDSFHTASFIGIVSLLAWGLGYFGQPHILVRFMSIRHENDMEKAKFIGMSWMGLSVLGSLAV